MKTLARSRQISASSEKSQERILHFMQNHPVGVLATVDPNGEPHATTIYYAVDDDFNITFMTKRATKKADNLKRKNHLVLVVQEAASQTVLQIKGVSEEIDDFYESNDAFRAMLGASLRTSESGIPPVSKLHAGEYIAYRINPKQIRMVGYIESRAGSYEIFETIEFDD